MAYRYGFDATGEEIADACADQIRGKVVLTTGVSPGGLGAFFLQLIAKYEPKLLILAARDISKAQMTAETIAAASPGVKTRLLQLDLSSQEQIRRAAREVNAYRESIDVLVNNAGLIACPYSTTQDGLEMQFGSMHIGHFLFTNLIMGKILAAGDGARVVSVSSDGYRLGPVRFNDWSFEHGQTYNKWRAYGQAKTANMLFAVSLAEKLGKKGLIASSLHPGVIATNLSRHTSDSGFAELKAFDRELGNEQGRWQSFPFKTTSQGVATHVFAAFHPSIADHKGSFFSHNQLVPPEDITPWARDALEANKLWKLSEEIVGEKFVFQTQVDERVKNIENCT